MSTDPALDQLTRDELVQRARALGARRPEVMTRVELRDEIVRLSEPDPVARRRSRGWLGVARDLVASVMDAGLNMPGAAAAIRGDARPAEETTGPPPVATLTLAEIYLAQGHAERALATLEEVLVAEPEHAAALALRERIVNERGGTPARRRVPPPLEPSAGDEPSAVDQPIPAPAPFVASIQPSFVASVEAPEATRSPDVGGGMTESRGAGEGSLGAELEATPEPVREAEPVLPPAAEVAVAEEEPSTPVSQPVPTLAAPPIAEDEELDAVFPAALADVHPECALLEQEGRVDGFYTLPPGASDAVLRIAWFVPTEEGPSVGTVDVPLDPSSHRVSLPRVEPTAHVRGVLGTGVAEAFRPLAVASVYRAEAGALALAFAPPEGESSLLRAEAQSLAHG